jgi:hypothetical protein
VFLFAVFCSGAVPWLFRSRFRHAYERYRGELVRGAHTCSTVDCSMSVRRRPEEPLWTTPPSA